MNADKHKETSAVILNSTLTSQVFFHDHCCLVLSNQSLSLSISIWHSTGTSDRWEPDTPRLSRILISFSHYAIATALLLPSLHVWWGAEGARGAWKWRGIFFHLFHELNDCTCWACLLARRQVASGILLQVERTFVYAEGLVAQKTSGQIRYAEKFI